MNSLEEIGKKKLSPDMLEDAMDLIYDNPEMRSMWKLYQGFVDSDEDYKFSPTEQLELELYGTMYLRCMKILGAMSDEDLLLELQRPSSPFARMTDMANRVEKLRTIAKKRAEKTSSRDFFDLDEVEINGESDDYSLSVTKKRKQPPIDLEDLEDL